jgi:hypothetical protein
MAASCFYPSDEFVENDGDDRDQDDAGQQLLHLEVLAPGRDHMTDAFA